MKYIFFTVVAVLCLYPLSAQTIQQIKDKPQEYLWGEGHGITLDEADQNALRFLVSSISTRVESEYQQNTEWGTGTDFTENVKMILHTYSTATLHNTERIVIANEPEAHVFRYIKRGEVAKIFEKRKIKIEEFVKTGIKAEENLRIADALKNYYWAFNLLKSLPNSGNMYMHCEKYGKIHLLSWIPDHMNTVFSNISFTEKNIMDDDNMRTIVLNVNYNNKPVTNLDYSYYTGNNWTNVISAKDGVGFLEFMGAAKDVKKAQLKVEYLFKSEAIIDKELETVMKQIRSVPFKASYYNIPFNLETADKKPTAPAQPTTDSTANGRTHIAKVIQAIQQQKTADTALFTKNGYNSYLKLIKYGNAKVLQQTELRQIEFNDKMIYRGTPMAFSFKNNNKQFVENIVWHCEKTTGKIDNLTFSLTDIALNNIWDKTIWKETDRLVLINFLENYKTAYALEKLDYISSIFADDALIITGYYTFDVDNNAKTDYSQHRVVKYNRYSKEQYLKKLEYSFKNKEFINIKFEESEIRKGGNDSIYGIQIKQSYYSSNYGDEGYLFLMADLSTPDKPIIHVRTWQPEKENGKVFSLGDF